MTGLAGDFLFLQHQFFLIWGILILWCRFFGKTSWWWTGALGASLWFFSLVGKQKLLVALGFIGLMSWLFGLLIQFTPAGGKRTAYFLLGLGVVAFPMFHFRFLGALVGLINSMIALKFPDFHIPEIPAMTAIGISYATFQGLGYLIDVYLETMPAELHPGYLALYLAFMPKILQGPIERAYSFLPRLRAGTRPAWEDVRLGVILFAWGMFQKVVIADNIRIYSTFVFAFPQPDLGWLFILATYLFAIQIYFDFAGYTDMARGIARTLGFELSPNFHSPYFASSIAEFWRRWHISFSGWLFEYLFRPIQMAFRRWRMANSLGLLVTFFVCGLWHGAAWTFVLWGLLQACLMIAWPWGEALVNRGWNPARGTLGARIRNLLAIILTFHLTCAGWILFRSSSVAGAGAIYLEIGKVLLHPLTLLTIGPELKVLASLQGWSFLWSMLGLALMLHHSWLRSRGWTWEDLSGQRWYIRWSLYYALLLSILFFGNFQNSAFVYFRF